MGWKTGTRNLRNGQFQTFLAGLPRPARHRRRSREKRTPRPVPINQLFAVPPVAALDPVQIAVLTLEHLSPASLRASFTGKEVCVAAPDAETAAVFRAALSQTAQTRSTDRLIRVIVE